MEKLTFVFWLFDHHFFSVLALKQFLQLNMITLNPIESIIVRFYCSAFNYHIFLLNKAPVMTWHRPPETGLTYFQNDEFERTMNFSYALPFLLTNCSLA